MTSSIQLFVRASFNRCLLLRGSIDRHRTAFLLPVSLTGSNWGHCLPSRIGILCWIGITRMFDTTGQAQHIGRNGYNFFQAPRHSARGPAPPAACRGLM
jgi:hypothetical protein